MHIHVSVVAVIWCLCVCYKHLDCTSNGALEHTPPFNGPFSGTTRVSWYQEDETNLDFTEARDSEWQWHQLGHMQICISLQTDNHASTPPLQMPFLPPNQQRQCTEGTLHWDIYPYYFCVTFFAVSLANRCEY